jgi:hypothetical protein
VVRRRSEAGVPPRELGTRTVATMLQNSAIGHRSNGSRLIECCDGEDVDQGHAALVAAFKNVKGTLESGLKAGERVGRADLGQVRA